jgi:L-seryl-tRNA(Ser) seleniumtransferase
MGRWDRRNYNTAGSTMRKAPAPAVDSGTDGLRSIPSVERILSSAAFSELIAEYGRERAKLAIVRHLGGIRQQRAAWNEGAAVAAVAGELASAMASTLRRVVNATGIIIHTNLGRSPIDPELWSSAADVVTGYSNLEFDLDSGERGKREEHLSGLCRSLFGCEAAVLTNNNASAALLLLAAVAAKKDVIVSRGELVEIGGSFRVPDVIQQGGARLIEVGTTNRTRAEDYAAAVTRKTAALLRVHRSNFDIVGFTETPSIQEMVDVARTKRVPLLYDEGTGRVVELSPYGFARAETIRELIDGGVDVVTCSTDKLIGATQGGLILGSEAIVSRVRKHPLMRALRAGKESYAVIAATLRAFATERHETLVPIYRMLAAPLDELRARAKELTAGTPHAIVESRAALGGGTTPAETIPSVAIAVAGDASALRARFLALPLPIAGRTTEDRFTLDLRTVLPADLPVLAAALR